jgi:hypothetical protein
MRDLGESDGGEMRFGSRKVAQEITALVESVEHHLRNAAGRGAQLVTMDKQRAESNAFQRWLSEYTVEVMESKVDGRPRIRIDTVLSDLKSTAHPTITEALRDGYSAWVRDGHDAAAFFDVLVEWSNRGESRTSKRSLRPRPSSNVSRSHQPGGDRPAGSPTGTRSTRSRHSGSETLAFDWAASPVTGNLNHLAMD